MLCLAFIFHLQPGCNYSIDVTSDEDSDIDHSLPRSRVVKVGSMHHTVMDTCVRVYHGIFWKHECLLLVNTTLIFLQTQHVDFCSDKGLCIVKRYAWWHASLWNLPMFLFSL